jgi:hypothetical protein
MPSLQLLSNSPSLMPVLFLLLAQHCITSSSSSAVLAAIGMPGRRESSASSSPLLDDHLALHLHHHKEEEKKRKSHRWFRRRVVQHVLQEQDATTTYYVADYVGRFHYTRHHLCTGPSSNALWTAACPLGGGRIELVRTSHPDYLQCEIVVEDDDGTNNATILSSNMLRCTTTCPTVAACSNIFFSVADSPSVYDGPYGEIYFRCIGIDPLQSTTGSFTYVGSDQADLAATMGHCAPFIGTGTINTWNIRVAQLGTYDCS